MALLLTACKTSGPTDPEDTAPIYITQPANGASVSDTVTVRAGTGSDYDIESVVFYIDDDSVYTDNVSPYLYQWDVTGYQANSEHDIVLYGYTSDSVYISQTVTVTVTLPSTNEFSHVYSYSLTGPAYRVDAQDDFVYAALGANGLKVIDVNVPTSPGEVYEFQQGTNIYGLDASGAYLVTAERDNGVRSFDISASDTVIAKYIYSTPGSSWNVKISGNLAYIADNDRLTIVSMANYGFTFVGQVVISTGIVKDVDVSGSTVYVLDQNGVSRYNVSNPANPIYQGRYQAFTGQCQCIFAYGNYVFVGTTGELRMLSNTLVSLAYSANQQGYTGVCAIDDVVFVSQGGSSGGARAFEYSNSSTLVQLDSYMINEICNDIAYLDSYVILAGTNQLEILRFNYSPTY